MNGSAREGTPWPAAPLGGLGHATRRVPASGGTRQPAKSPQSRGAKQHVLMLCVPGRQPCSTGSAFSLSTALPHQQQVFCRGTSCSLPHPTGTQRPTLGEVRARSSPSGESRELPGCTAGLGAPPCFGGRWQSSQTGCKQAARQSQPVLWAPSGWLCWASMSHHPPTRTQTWWPCWTSHSPSWVT